MSKTAHKNPPRPRTHLELCAQVCSCGHARYWHLGRIEGEPCEFTVEGGGAGAPYCDCTAFSITEDPA